MRTRQKQKVKTQKDMVLNNANPTAVAGFVLSFLVPVLGLIFSAIGRHKTKYGLCKGRKLSTAGIIISIVVLVGHCCFWIGTFIAAYYGML